MLRNLKLVNGSRDICTIDEATYISKAIAGPLSTEHFKGAFQRKIPSFIALFQDEPGLTGDAMYTGLTDESLRIIARTAPELLKPVHFKEALAEELEYVYTHRDEYKRKRDQRPSGAEGSASKIADIIFAKHDQS